MNRIIKGERVAQDPVAPRADPDETLLSAPARVAAPAPAPAAAPASPHVVRADIFDARNEARAIVEAASREAAQTRARLAGEVAAARAQGERDGYEEGLARATLVLARAHAERDAVLASAEPEILELALHAAAKILGREVEERGAAVDIVAQALCAVRRAKAVRLRISPLDAAALRVSEPALAERLAQGAALVLVEDATIGRGGCAIETETGRIDARHETQLEALRRAVRRDEGPP